MKAANQAVQELLASQMVPVWYKPNYGHRSIVGLSFEKERQGSGFRLLAAWDRSKRTFACVDAMVSCLLKPKHPMQQEAKEWLEAQDETTWDLALAALLIRAGYSTESEQCVNAVVREYGECLQAKYNELWQQCDETGQISWQTLTRGLNLHSFRYYPPLDNLSRHLFAACTWLRGSYEPRDWPALCQRLSVDPKLPEMPQVRAAIVRAVALGLAPLDLLGDFKAYAVEITETIITKHSLAHFDRMSKEEARLRYQLTEKLLTVMPELSGEAQRAVFEKLFAAGVWWIWFYTKSILESANSILPDDDPLWHAAGDWLLYWLRCSFWNSSAGGEVCWCFSGVDSEMNKRVDNFCNNLPGAKEFQECLKLYPKPVCVAIAAKLYKDGSGNNQNHPMALLGDLSGYREILRIAPDLARELFGTLLPTDAISYEAAEVYAEVFDDPDAIVRWWRPQRAMGDSERLAVAKRMMENGKVVDEFKTVSNVPALLSAGYQLTAEDVGTPERLTRLLYFGKPVPWFDKGFVKWRMVILTNSCDAATVLATITNSAVYAHMGDREAAYQLFCKAIRPLLARADFLDAAMNLAWVKTADGQRFQQFDSYHSVCQYLLRRYLATRAGDPIVFTEARLQQAHDYHLALLTAGDTRELEWIQPFVQKDEVLAAIFKTTRGTPAASACGHLAAMIDEGDMKRVVGGLLKCASDERLQAGVWLEWVEYFGLTCEPRIRAKIVSLACGVPGTLSLSGYAHYACQLLEIPKPE